MLSFLFPSGDKELDIQLSVENPISVDAETYTINCCITNTSTEIKKFCTYFTPFENLSGEIFKIKKSDSSKVDYVGVMKKRKGPKETDYISLNPGKSINTVIDIKKGYDFSGPGTYKVQFKGRDINNLSKSNKLKLIIQ